MSNPLFNRYLLTLVTGIAVLAGCGASQLAPSGALPLVRNVVHRASHGRTWMDSRAAKWDLLYVTNSNGVVNVYRYWQHTLIGVLTDFDQPWNECVDRTGDVYITDYGTKRIDEYAHGGKKPIHVIDDSPYYPAACSVDYKSGNLAIANSGYGRGNIAVYVHAKGKPILYTDPNIYGFAVVGYDDRGNLLASNGCTYDSSCYGASFAFLPNKAVNLITIDVPGPGSSWYYENVESIQWDGEYWAIDAYDNLYRITIADNKAYYVGMTTISQSVGNPVWIYRKNLKSSGTQVVGSGMQSDQTIIAYWNYPAGGSPIAEATKGLDGPFGVTISLRQ